MKRLVFFSVAFVALLLSSCQKPQINEGPSSEITPAVAFSFKASCQDLLGKATYTEQRKVYWTEGDAVSLFYNEGSANNKFTLSAGEGTGDGTFSGEVALAPEGPHKFTAIFPYSEAYTADASGVTVNLATTQTAYRGEAAVTHPEGQFMMVSTKTVAEATEDVALSFTSPVALMKFSILSGGDASWAAEKLFAVRMKSTSTNFAGSVKFDWDGNPISAPTAKEITVKQRITKENTAIGEKRDVYMTVWPCDLTGEDITVEIETISGKTITIATRLQKAIEAQTDYTLTINIPAFITKGYAFVEAPIDLSKTGTANCYVVEDEGYYCFKSTHKGNSSADEDKITGAKADWLWYDGSDNVIEDVEYRNDYILFHANQTKGNALIALFNSSNRVVWSWHIWATDDPTETTHWTRNSAWVIMDRNLGATSAQVGSLDAYGLLYLWGSKNPAVGANTVGAYTNNAKLNSNGFSADTKEFHFNPTYTAYTAFGGTRSSNLTTNGEIDYVTLNPNMFPYYHANALANCGGISDSWMNHDISKTEDSYYTLWGCDATGNKLPKTKYDPCPPGWRVPHDSGYFYRNASKSGKWDPTYVTKEAGNICGAVLNDTENDNYAYYPAAGYRNSLNLFHVGYAGVYWSGYLTINGTSSQAWAMYFCGNVNDNTVLATVAGGKRFSSATLASVRCVKE